ncbi:hypothetical protein DBR06_SOUSAS13510011, partial [Sousa chinensis]
NSISQNPSVTEMQQVRSCNRYIQ